MKNDLIKIKVINPRALGKLNGIEVYLTKGLENKLAKQKTSNGILLDQFKNGRALRGFKHLIEIIQSKDKKAKIIFSDTKTERTKDEFHINYEEYRKITQGKFFALYRETGLDSASFFLNSRFPDEFDYDKGRVTEVQLKKIDKNFSQVLQDLSHKTKNKKILLQQTSEAIQSLKDQKIILKSEIVQLEELQNNSNIVIFQNRIKELEDRLLSPRSYAETKGMNSWQSWIYRNNWLLGTQYQQPIQKQKINLSGSMPDYLFPTIDGFLDILEIKLPSNDVVIEDSSHPGSYRWCGETNKTIGQVVNYLNDIERLQLELSRAIKREYEWDVFVVKPRAFIIVGTKNNWNETKKEALRKLNYSLHGIEVLTYTDLILRGQEIIRRYTQKL
jgi:hypothetical protein